MTEDARIRSLLDTLLDAFNAHDLDRIMALFAEDCVLEMPRGPQPCGQAHHGRPAVRAALAGRFAGMPDVRYRDPVHHVAGDTGITRWTITGTPAEGPPIEQWGCDFYTFRDGMVVRKNSFWKIRG